MKMQIFSAKDDVYNRNLLEKKKEIIIEGIEYSDKEDSPKYLASGLNSIMARIASKNNNSLGIDVQRLSGLPKEKKARILARVRQNIELCRKPHVTIALNCGKEERLAVIESLGGSTQQASQAISF